MAAFAPTREVERDMMLSPTKWPHFYLPLKRHTEAGWPECAVLMTATMDATVPLRVLKNQTIYGPLPGGPDEEIFKDIDALLDAGWRVD